MSSLSWFAGFFQGGGPFMFVILAAGLMILALTIERVWVVGRASAWNAHKLANDLTKQARRGDLDGAIDRARRVKGPVGRVALAVLMSPDRSEASLAGAAEGEALIALAPYSRRISHIGLLGNVATLLGLLGTIFGLTTAFAAVGAADPSQRSAFLAAGISQALNTTAFGLIVAVPALVVHGFLVGRVESIAEGVDEVAVRLVRALTRSEATASHASPEGAPYAGTASVSHGPPVGAPHATPVATRHAPASVAAHPASSR